MNTQFELFRKDLDRIFDGTEQQPGVLRMLDRHNEIAASEGAAETVAAGG